MTDPDLSTLTRDLLANERTYLAWLRTGVALMVVGLAVAQLVDPGHLGPLLAGVLLVAAGAGGVVFGTLRSKAAAAAIERGEVAGRAGGRTMTAVAAVLILTIVLALALGLVF